MKNIKIYPNDWLQLHPYKQSGTTDLYYTNIANRIYDIMEKTGLIFSFEDDEPKQICTRMAAYFEDVISQTNIWRTFITTHKEMFGKYLPFYTPDDHYYDDEVNLEDIRFLLWHYTQQYHGYRKSTFVNPDNATNEKTGKLIYQLFCDEWTTAPENETLQKLFSPEISYTEPGRYEELLFWFHYNSYLFTDHSLELTERVKEILQKDPYQENINRIIIQQHQFLAYTDHTALLALTSPEWLYRILPATHPDTNAFKLVVEKSTYKMISDEIKSKNLESYEKFKKAADGKLLVYSQDLNEIKEFLTEKVGISLDKEFHFLERLRGKKLAIYATPEDGLMFMDTNIEVIKDENNPFYDEKLAGEKGLSFFIVGHCTPSMLKILEEKGMLADAQTKSTVSVERGKAIIHDDWQFINRYFTREYLYE